MVLSSFQEIKSGGMIHIKLPISVSKNMYSLYYSTTGSFYVDIIRVLEYINKNTALHIYIYIYCSTVSNVNLTPSTSTSGWDYRMYVCMYVVHVSWK